MPQLIKKLENTLDKKEYPNVKLILHNDDSVFGLYVIESIVEILNLPEEVSVNKVMEAHYFDVSILGTYPLEVAEHYSELFCQRNILVTSE